MRGYIYYLQIFIEKMDGMGYSTLNVSNRNVCAISKRYGVFDSLAYRYEILRSLALMNFAFIIKWFLGLLLCLLLEYFLTLERIDF